MCMHTTYHLDIADLQQNLIHAIKWDSVQDFIEHMAILDLDINRPFTFMGRKIDGMVPVEGVERTSLMLAAMFGSMKVLECILGVPGLVVNECSRTDDVTALDCAYFYESRDSAKAHSRLIDHGAVHGPCDYITLSVFWPNKYAEFCELGMWCERVECIKAHNILEFRGPVIDSDRRFLPLPGHWTDVAPSY